MQTIDPGPQARLAAVLEEPYLLRTVVARLAQGETLQDLRRAWQLPRSFSERLVAEYPEAIAAGFRMKNDPRIRSFLMNKCWQRLGLPFVIVPGPWQRFHLDGMELEFRASFSDCGEPLLTIRMPPPCGGLI